MKKLRIHWGRFVGTVVLLASPFLARAVDAEFFGVVKMLRFAQDNATAPALAERESEDEEPPFVLISPAATQ